MKIAADTTLVTSTFEGLDERRMDVDADGIGSIMMLLSTIYSSSAEAVLREYATNARDSHVLAGTDEPVRILLPTDTDPDLRIVDHGVGLSRSEAREVFATYGRSTKRDRDDQIGAFGIGSKSAFTLSPQFSVTAVKDGMRTVMLCSLNDAEEPTTTILDHSCTEEPSGVTISIPVSPDQARSMRTAAPRVFALWPRGTVTVDGEAPEPLELCGRTTTALFPAYAPELGIRGVMVEMGGTLYEVPGSVLDAVGSSIVRPNWSMSSPVLLHVDMGAVHLVPNREAVRDTPRTRRAVGEALKAMVRELEEMVSAFATSTSPVERARITATLAAAPITNELRQELTDGTVPKNVLPKGASQFYSTEEIRRTFSSARRKMDPWEDVFPTRLLEGSGPLVVLGHRGDTVRRSVMRKWVFKHGCEDLPGVILVSGDELEVYGIPVTVQNPRGLRVMSYTDMKEQAREVKLPSQSDRSAGPIEYPVHRTASRVLDMTCQEIAEEHADATIVVSGPVTLAQAVVDQQELDRHLFVSVDAPRTEKAFRDRMQRAGFTGRIISGSTFEQEVLIPACEPHFDAVLAPTYRRPAIVVALMDRLGRLAPAVRELLEKHPHTAHDNDTSAVPEAVRPFARTVREYAQRQGRRAVLPSFETLALGSGLVERMLHSYAYSMTREVSADTIDDVIAVLNAREHIARAQLKAQREQDCT